MRTLQVYVYSAGVRRRKKCLISFFALMDMRNHTLRLAKLPFDRNTRFSYLYLMGAQLTQFASLPVWPHLVALKLPSG